MYELNSDQLDIISGGSKESYEAGHEIGEAIGKAIKYAGVIMLFAAAWAS